MNTLLKPLAIAAMSIAMLMPAKASEMTCAGTLTDMRTVGIQIGNCDLNSISDKELKRVTRICGLPGGIDKTAPQCRIRAIVSPHEPNKYGTGFVNVVQKILVISKGAQK